MKIKKRSKNLHLLLSSVVPVVVIAMFGMPDDSFDFQITINPSAGTGHAGYPNN